jgi:hypothetical protein
MKKLIIGISGKMGTGKSTVTNILVEALGKHRSERISLAKPIYNAQDALYKMYGLEMEGEKDRDLLIAIGLWGRNKNPDFWLDQLAKYAIETDKEVLICDDVRFENEANFIDKVGFLIRIDGEQRGSNVDISRKEDPTECSLDTYNFKHRVSNTLSPEDMCKKIAKMLLKSAE